MKKKLTGHLAAVITIALVLLLLMNCLLQTLAAQRDMVRSSGVLFKQVGNVVEKNQGELESVKQDFQGICLLRANTAAYILQNDKAVIEDIQELRKIVSLLEIDELHVFDKEGTLYAGSEPKYYNLTFHSGEQMEYFLPMLEDTSLELCQDITPNTAEGKLMQYAAVWMEDGTAIVQIGMEPRRVMEMTEKNEISYVFSLFAEEDGTTLFAVDPETNQVIGTTDEQLLNREMESLGVEKKKMEQWGNGFHCKLNGVPCYCVFEESDSVILGRAYTLEELYRNVKSGSLQMLLYVVIAFMVMMFSIIRYIKKNVISSITDINDKLQQITDGNLDERVDVRNVPEFAELSDHINGMVETILGSTAKLSSVLDMTRLQVGWYEYNQTMDRVRTTNKLQKILNLTDEKADALFGDHTLFEEWMEKIYENPLKGEEDVYILPEAEGHYIKAEQLSSENSVFGLVIDKTEDIRIKNMLEQQLGQDMLTGLDSRRAFYSKLDILAVERKPEDYGAVVVIDSDDLKLINDTYGHEVGDRYLCSIAEALRSVGAPSQVTARVGGDEFAVLFHGMNQAAVTQAIDKLYELRKRWSMQVKGGPEIFVCYSAGVARFPEDGTDLNELMQMADERMYLDKKSRKAGRFA